MAGTAPRHADKSADQTTKLPIRHGLHVKSPDGRPIDFLDADRAQMLTLPPVVPTVETVASVRLGRDYYVRVAGNDYSVDPTAIGQLVDVHTTLAAVTVRRAGRLLAAHDRCWATRQTLTDPTHVATASALRQQFQTGPPPAAGDHLMRDLADYDRAFGVDFTTGAATSDGEVA